MWGDQWECWCGWSNFILRKKCRNCGVTRPEQPRIKTWREVMKEPEKKRASTSNPQ
jgi:hypothetical protein